jgi:hypothetical protein
MFVFRRIDPVSDRLYHVDPLTCTEGDFKLKSVVWAFLSIQFQ